MPIAEFISGLREELRAAEAERDPQLQFNVGPVTVEFTVVTGREGGPEGKVRFWVIEAGGAAKWSNSETQTVTLTLTPVDERGQDVRIGDRVRKPPPGLPGQ
ncbi:trypco2 family protein [Geodermatophilus saharensis]|uniref:trypco2 family protein n=1 Tax=Geodermatophilus saharensis TaxID=1137994 RepID=UPI000B78771F|nr:trypco2 family protein [Geodermatophilus saharensis]